MNSKAIVFLCLTALVLVVISSEVSARDLAEAETESTVSSTGTPGLENYGYGKGHGKGYGKGYGGKGHGKGGHYGCKCCGSYHCKCCGAANQAEATVAEVEPQN